MSDKPKRRFWQIHLSTAIVMMICASVLLGLNMVNYDSGAEVIPDLTRFYYRGWPVSYLVAYDDVLVYPVNWERVIYDIKYCATIWVIVSVVFEFCVRFLGRNRAVEEAAPVQKK